MTQSSRSLGSFSGAHVHAHAERPEELETSMPGPDAVVVHSRATASPACRPPATDSEALISRTAGERVPQLGFQYWAYSVWADTPRERVWSTHNAPADLWDAYVNAGSGQARTGTPPPAAYLLPMLWDLSHLPERIDPPASPRDRLISLVRQYGLACGMQLPLYASGRLVATLMLASSSPPSERIRELGFQHGMSLLAELHQCCPPPWPQVQRPPAPQVLTARERECLKWASLGKTTWEIGRLVHISEHTARFHLRNACSKLSASNRQQAVAKAIHCGYLS